MLVRVLCQDPLPYAGEPILVVHNRQVLFHVNKELVEILRLARLLGGDAHCTHCLHVAHAVGRVLAAQYEREHTTEAKQVQKVPGQRGDPADIHIRRHNPGLQHRLEASTKREGKADENEASEEELDPAHDEGLWYHPHHLALHALHHGVHDFWVHHRIHRALALLVLVLEVLAILECLAEIALSRLYS